MRINSTKMLLKFCIFHALIALSVGDVTELNRGYLPPPVVVNHEKLNNNEYKGSQPQQQQQVLNIEVLRDEAADGNAHVITDVPQSLDIVPEATTKQSPASASSGDPFYQPSFGGVGVGGFPSASASGPLFPGQGFPLPNVYRPGFVGQFPGQGFPGQSFPGQGFPGQGFPGQSLPGQGFPGQGFLGQGFPGQSFPGQAFPGQVIPGQGFPAQGFPGQAFPGQSLPIQSFPGQGFPGQFFPGQGFPGQFFPGQGFPGQGFPPLVGGFPGIPFSITQQPGVSSSSSDTDNSEQLTRKASDTIYGTNGGYVYEKPK